MMSTFIIVGVCAAILVAILLTNRKAFLSLLGDVAKAVVKFVLAAISILSKVVVIVSKAIFEIYKQIRARIGSHSKN